MTSWSHAASGRPLRRPVPPRCSEAAGCAPLRTTYPGSMSVDQTVPGSARPAPAPDAPALRIRRSPAVPMPRRAHPDDAGLDLASAEEVEIPAGGRALVDTGLAVALPAGTRGMVAPPPALPARLRIPGRNRPGLRDAGCRGPQKVPMH